jgi:hypothetical protein
MAALSDFKNERIKCQLSYRAKLFSKHPRYSMMYKHYHVPEESCSPYKLMSKVDKDRDVLYRIRCAPLNEYYSMLMEDTPGYVPSAHWDRSQSSVVSRNNDRDRSISRSSNSSEYPLKNPIKNLDESSSVMMRKSSSAREPSSTKLDVLWGSTEHFSDRRFKNSQRGPRVIPIPGEEPGYTSESGNDEEDHDNTFYDSRMVPSDKTLLADWLHKIRKIKSNDLSMDYLKDRDEWIRIAENERIKNGIIHPVLHDVEPPYDKGKGLAPVRYNEMRVVDFEKIIAALRERNAASCAKYDAAQKHGPRSGQGRR